MIFPLHNSLTGTVPAARNWVNTVAFNPNEDPLNKPIPPDLDPRHITDAKISGQRISVQKSILQTEVQTEGLTEDINKNIVQIRFDSDTFLKQFRPGQGFQTVQYSVPASQSLLVVPPAKQRHSYYIANLTNPASFVPTATQGTLTIFALQAYPAAGSPYSSVVLTPDIPAAATVYLTITTVAGTSLVISYQAKDPLSGNFVTVVADVFTGANTIGTFRAQIPTLSFDAQGKFIATVVGTTPTFSMSMVLVPSLTNLGPSLYLGTNAVTTLTGMPLFPFQYIVWNPFDNIGLYAFNPNTSISFPISVTDLGYGQG